MLFNFVVNFKKFFKTPYFSRQMSSGNSKKGLKAHVLMDSVVSWWQTEGRELCSRASCILGCYRLCWPGWSHKGFCAIWPLFCTPPAGPSCTAGSLLGFKVLLHSTDYIEGLNLGSLQISSYNCRNMYFERMTGSPFLDRCSHPLACGWITSLNAALMIQDLQCLLNCCTVK